MGKRWQEKRKNDKFYKKAKEEGYRSRASYKLKQLDEKYNLIRKGDIIIDLGAAPGGWLQVGMEKTGKNGEIIGVDLEEINEIDKPNLKTIKGDLTEEETKNKIQKNLPKKADVIISDASPKITGNWDIDHARSIDLGNHCLKIAEKNLKTGGNLLMKIFQGEYFPELLKKSKQKFDFCKSSKPEASRDQSSEIYIIGKRFQK